MAQSQSFSYAVLVEMHTAVMVTRSGRRVWNTNPSCFAPRTKARSSEGKQHHISTAFSTKVSSSMFTCSCYFVLWPQNRKKG